MRSILAAPALLAACGGGGAAPHPVLWDCEEGVTCGAGADLTEGRLRYRVCAAPDPEAPDGEQRPIDPGKALGSSALLDRARVEYCPTGRVTFHRTSPCRDGWSCALVSEDDCTPEAEQDWDLSGQAFVLPDPPLAAEDCR